MVTQEREAPLEEEGEGQEEAPKTPNVWGGKRREVLIYKVINGARSVVPVDDETWEYILGCVGIGRKYDSFSKNTSGVLLPKGMRALNIGASPVIGALLEERGVSVDSPEGRYISSVFFLAHVTNMYMNASKVVEDIREGVRVFETEADKVTRLTAKQQEAKRFGKVRDVMEASIAAYGELHLPNRAYRESLTMAIAEASFQGSRVRMKPQFSYLK